MTLLLVVLSNIIYPLQVVFGTSSSDLIEIKERNRVSEDRASFQIGVLKPGTVDTLDIELPEFSTVDEDEMDNQARDYQWEYDEEQNKVMIHNISEDITEVTVSLKNISTGQHVLSVIPLYEGQEADKVVHSFETMSVIEETQEEATEIEAEKQESITNQEELPVHNETAPELQRDLSIQRVGGEFVESGNDALFKLTLKTTGSQVKYNQSKIIVQIPEVKTVNFTQDLQELEMAGVVPTYDSMTRQLTYHFDELKSGQTYERIIKLNTENGMMLNGTVISIKTKLHLENELTSAEPYMEAKKKIKSGHSIVIEKVAMKSAKPPKPGSTVSWKINVSIPKCQTGQLYLKEGTEIKVIDTLPKGLEFIKSQIGTDKPTVNQNKLIWTFKAPSLAEQKTQSESLFSKTLIIDTKVNNVGEVVNQADVEATFLDGIELKPGATTKGKVLVFDSTPNTGEINGTIQTPLHLGPTDGTGTKVGTGNSRDPNPEVHDDEYLLFEHGIRAFYYGYYHDMDKYILSYKIDKKLILDKLTTPGGPVMGQDWYRARDNTESKKDGIPLTSFPTYDLVLIYEDTKGKEGKLTLKNPEQGVVLTRKDFVAAGFNNEYRIKEVLYDFTNAPYGLATDRIKYYFKIQQGASGRVENTFNMTGTTAMKEMKDMSTNSYANLANHNLKKQREFNLQKDFPSDV